MCWRFTAALFVLTLAQAWGQGDALAAGKFLVASRELGDPNFAQTVVLLVSYDSEKGAMGLIVNRQTEVPMSRLFQDLKGAKGRSDPVYVGGPVELETVQGLLKSSSKPGADAKHVFGDVYLITSKELFEKTLASQADASIFHIYVGYAGWGAGQLEHEIDLGGWHVMAADASNVFHSEPDSVWPRLIKRTEMQIAQHRPMPIAQP